MPKLAGDRPGGALVVAGEHEDLAAQAVQRADGLGRRWLDRIGDGQQAGVPAADGHEDHRAAVRVAARGLLLHQRRQRRSCVV